MFKVDNNTLHLLKVNNADPRRIDKWARFIKMNNKDTRTTLLSCFSCCPWTGFYPVLRYLISYFKHRKLFFCFYCWLWTSFFRLETETSLEICETSMMKLFCEMLTVICSKLTIKTPERRQWLRSGVLTVNFKHVAVYYFRKKAPSQMFDRVLNTSI